MAINVAMKSSTNKPLFSKGLKACLQVSTWSKSMGPLHFQLYLQNMLCASRWVLVIFLLPGLWKLKLTLHYFDSLKQATSHTLCDQEVFRTCPIDFILLNTSVFTNSGSSWFTPFLHSVRWGLLLQYLTALSWMTSSTLHSSSTRGNNG